jgi:hypothetical protein
MLYLESPILFINGLQIHRDFQNPNQFYFFPAAPRLHRDRDTDRPAFQLIKYARDVTDNPLMPPGTKEQIGGGFLMMTVDIGVDDEVLTDTRNKLAAYAEGEVLLAPVPFHTGAVRLIALGAGDGQGTESEAQATDVFVEKVYGATKPSLYGDNLAIFGVHLKQEGVTLVEDSFRHGGGLIGVVYDLTYTGIRPAIQVKAKVDYARVYNRFEAQLGFQYATIGAELEATLEFLREQGAIQIEITQYDPEPNTGDQLRREAMELIKNEIIAKMFKPSLQVPTAATRTGSMLDQVVRLAKDLSQPPAPNQENVPAPQPRDTSEGERGPQTMDRQAGNSGGGGSGGGPGQKPGFALTFSLKFLHQEERRVAELDFRVNQAVNRTASPQGSIALLREGIELEDHVRQVNLDDPIFRELGARIGVTGGWEELGIEKIVVNATYQPTPNGPIVHTDGWTFSSPDDPLKPFNVLLEPNNPVRQYRYKTQIFLKDLSSVDSKSRVLTREDVTEQRELVIHPANEFRPLLVSIEPSQLDWTKVNQIDVNLKYADTDNQFEAEQLFSFRADRTGAQKWIVYPVNPDLRAYEVTLAYHLADPDHTFFKLAPMRCTEEGLVVPEPFKGARPVRLIPAVDKEDVRELTAEIMFEKNGYRFHREETFADGVFQTRTVDIPIVDPDPLTDAYQARWSLTKNNWEVVDIGWKSFQASPLILSDGVHSVQPVKVMFIRSPAEAGLASLLLKLESLTPTGDVVDTDTLLLKGATAEAATELLLMQGTPLRYQYTLTKFNGGASEVVGPVESREREIFVAL